MRSFKCAKYHITGMFCHRDLTPLKIGHFEDIFDFFQENLDQVFKGKNELLENRNEVIFCCTSIDGIK